MAYQEPGGSNTFIADHEATGNLQIEYSRNPKSFKLMRYSERRPVTKSRGFYLNIDPLQAGRVRYDDGREFAWPSGAESPTGTDNLSQFQFNSYLTRRFANPVLLDERGVQQSSWAVRETELRKLAQQSMTLQTRKVFKALAAATWGANAGVVTTMTGNSAKHWGTGTVLLPYIKQTLQTATLQILQSTVGSILPEHLVLVIGPDTATAMSQSAEIQAMLSNSVYAYGLLTGTLPGVGQQNWSLPPMLYDIRVAVEDTVVVTSAKGAATAVTTYAIPPGSAYLLARAENEMINPTILKAEEGEIQLTEEERENVPVNSTVAIFSKEEMTTEQRVDGWHRISEARITNDFDVQITSVLGGFKFSSVLG